MSTPVAKKIPTKDLSREDIFALLEEQLSNLSSSGRSNPERREGMRLLLDWLEGAQGTSWQQRWEALGEATEDWRAEAGATSKRQFYGIIHALQTLMCHRIVRPSYAWMNRQNFHQLSNQLRKTTDREDLERLLDAAKEAGANGGTVLMALSLLTKVLIHTGKRVPQLTTDDLLEYRAVATVNGNYTNGLHTAHLLLRQAGIIDDPPMTIGSAFRLGQYTVEEMVERYGVQCQPIKALFIRYLKERQPALDYASLSHLALRLVKLFWRDLELHHPGISSLRLPTEVAEAWKGRARLLPDGRPRRDVGTLFTDVRCFYLDLAQWAAENPKVWKGCALPSPISEADMRAFSKGKHKRRAEMHARVRALAPLLPKLVSAVRKRHRAARGLLEAALACNEGDTFSYGGAHYLRVIPDRSKSRRQFGHLAVRARPLDDPEAEVINCRTSEEDAFWAWAVVEVLRLTGIRLEELLELTHLSVRQHKMQDGQKVLLLQIAPSKTDRERVLPVCPELAHALAAIVSRIKGDSSRIPTIVHYDTHERDFSAQLPYLFQMRRGGQLILISGGGARALLTRASKLADLQDVDSEPIRLTPHDFRRLFATEAVNGGLPIHIAAKLLGHLDVNTTRGYTAIYPEEVVRHFQAHVARRRVLRPTEEYREPTEQEWTEFATHFRRRRMALGDCYRPYGTDCPHEHACVRCPMLRMDPAQKPRLLQIEDNTHELLAEARENNWEGEVKGLEVTLVHIGEKKAQVDGILAARNEAADNP